jgi:short-subunit dehydrogenase
MRSLIFGASAGVGRALARCLARRNHDLVLAARGAADLAAEAAHLRLSFGVNVQWVALDATDPVAVSARIAEICDDSIPGNLLFPVGLADEGDDCFLPAENTIDLIHANLTSVITVVATLLPKLIEGSRDGNVVGFGSVAAVRGRGTNVVYAAAKRGLEGYFESLRHRTTTSAIRVQYYRLGHIATQMNYGRDSPFPVAAPDWVAERVADGLGRDLGLVHLPRFWAGITPAVRAVPWQLYRRAQF